MARSEPQGGHFATDRLISDFGPPPPGPAATAWSQTTTEQIKPASESVDKVVLDLGEKVDTLIEMLKAIEAKMDGVTPPKKDEEETRSPDDAPDLGQKVDTLIEMLKAIEAKIDGVTPPGEEDAMDDGLQLVMTFLKALDVVIDRLRLKDDGTKLSDDEQQAVHDFSDLLEKMQALKADTSPPRLTSVELDRMLDGLKALKAQDPPTYQQMVARLREVID
jgi:hypothetical protein